MRRSLLRCLSAVVVSRLHFGDVLIPKTEEGVVIEHAAGDTHIPIIGIFRLFGFEEIVIICIAAVTETGADAVFIVSAGVIVIGIPCKTCKSQNKAGFRAVVPYGAENFLCTLFAAGFQCGDAVSQGAGKMGALQCGFSVMPSFSQ